MVSGNIEAQLSALRVSLEERLTQVDSEIERLARLRQAIEQRLVAVAQLLNNPLDDMELLPPRRRDEVRTGDDLKGKTVPDACEIVLREHGGPMKVADIVSQITSRGLRIASVTPWRTVNTALLRNRKRFVKFAPGTYTLAPRAGDAASAASHARLNKRGPVVHAHDVLAEARRPMHIKDILSIMLKQGFKTNAGRPEAMLSGTLKQSRRFRLVGGDIWALAEWPDKNATVKKGGDTQ